MIQKKSGITRVPMYLAMGGALATLFIVFGALCLKSYRSRQLADGYPEGEPNRIAGKRSYPDFLIRAGENDRVGPVVPVKRDVVNQLSPLAKESSTEKDKKLQEEDKARRSLIEVPLKETLNSDRDRLFDKAAARSIFPKSKDPHEHPHLVTEKTGDRILSAGSLIPAVLKEGINSELPGEVRAQVSQNVYDTLTGEDLLIPQGATLLGRYGSDVVFGQSRVLLAWERIGFPDGQTLRLSAMEGSDSLGYAGFSDQVNNHYGKVFGSALLLSVFSAAAQLSQPQRGLFDAQSPGAVAAGALGQNLSTAGSEITRRNLTIPPTIEVRPGYRFLVKVNRDVSFSKVKKSEAVS
jgi:type IV secretory pathway VirB10-like protein